MRVALLGATYLIAVGGLASCSLNPEYCGENAESEFCDFQKSTLPPSVRPSNLRAQWSTPNQVRWIWELDEGSVDDLFAYELVTGPTALDVERRTTNSRIWTADDNPELGHFLLQYQDNNVPVVASVTDGFAPNQVVYAQLTAIDNAGRTAATNVANARTSEEALNELVIFDEVEPAGYRQPTDFQLSTGDPNSGSANFAWSAGATPDQWTNLRFSQMALDLSAISQSDFSDVFVELALALEATGTPWYSEIGLWYGGEFYPENEHNSLSPPFTPRRDGEYHIIQVPLRSMRPIWDGAGERVPFSELARGLHQFSVGGGFVAGSVVRVDDVRLRW